DDIYGEDIYGGVSEVGKSDTAVPSSNGYASQGQLRSAQASLQEWRNAFQSIAANAGLALEPTALLAHLQQTHQQPATTNSSGNTPTEDMSVLRQRESQLQAQLMEKILENMELRRHLQAAKAAAEPNVVQAYLFASPMLCSFIIKSDL
ncbi:MAG: hypothetical protein FRX49_13830, partial [Trebouxia sp. A1-2]